MSGTATSDAIESPPGPQEEGPPGRGRGPLSSSRKSAAAVRSPVPKESGVGREVAGSKKTTRLVGVRIPDSGMIYRFVSTLRELRPGDAVFLLGKEEESIGWVQFVTDLDGRELLQERVFTGVFDRILRPLTGAERTFMESRELLEQQAKRVCHTLIRELQLPMRLSRVQYLVAGGKLLVFFTAEGRVDFRELVRVLGSRLKVRVEMRHIGVRDEAKLLGGVGLCGREFCCTSHLKRFHPVSVRMAKNQDLSLNPEGISGSCGRLLCCLAYENSTYQALREGMPRLKQLVHSVDGREGLVQAVHPLMGTVEFQMADGSRVCCARCDLRHNTGLPGEGAQGEPSDDPIDEEDPVAVSGGDAAPMAGVDAGRPPQPRRERSREVARQRSAPARAEEKTVAPPVTPSVMGLTSDPVAPSPARKRRRRRRSSATTPSESSTP
ncbi:MAG: hypothetical protein H7837_11035 [Magnetococcus sp. MYC-9]